ncbi:hypothetical protein [Acidithiobacillus sulfurivorans]|uniref:ATP-binding protein n=1 Tax=Acidithiobacillus sulfurivorans TaxID=1958756 RepID=A0ABS5ZW05_9PROT|nr:hypothetical protein [Acidithiobacillus sulfurivorans]MBU2759268.1 ATP-binding protein [Acidithiobacillus sulfurivorans]
MSIVQIVDDVFRAVESVTHTGDLRFITDLETVDDNRTLVLSDGSLMSLVRVKGSMSLVGVEEYDNINRGVHSVMKNGLASVGHSVIVYFHRNPHDTSDVEKVFDGMRGTLSAFGMSSADDVLDDWQTAVSRYVSKEGIYVALITRLSSLPPSMRRQQKARVKKQALSILPLMHHDGQRFNRIATDLRDGHRSFVDTFIGEMRSPKVRVLAEVMSVRDAIYTMRSSLSPTGSTYKPILPGDRFPLRVKDEIKNRYGAPSQAELYYPSLARQIIKEDARFVDDTVVKWGDRYWRGLVMDIPPEEPCNFNVLFSKIPMDIEWRIAFHIEADGMGPLWWKSALTALFAKTSSVNARYNQALHELQADRLAGEAVVRFKCALSVCARDEETLKNHASEVASDVNLWGHATVAAPMGMGQLLAIASTIPGLKSGNPAPAAAAPLMDIVGMLPFLRPASTWDSGTPYRTNDGRFLPFREGSGQQSSFIEVGSGPLGSGKSNNANVANFTFFVAPGQPRMPFLSIIDVGPSSSGVISLIRESLPEDQKHLAIYVRMRNTLDFSVNPFDTAVGCREPLPLHKGFLTNLMSLIGTPYVDKHPPDKVPGMASLIIDKAYQSLSDNQSPRIYRPRYDPDNLDCIRLDRVIAEEVQEGRLTLDDHTSWWEIVDYFFRKGELGNASIAQRFAVPTLGEVAAYLNDAQVVRMYGEPATHDFGLKCSEALQRYRVFALPTRFTIGEARAVSLDLDEVATKGSSLDDRQTAIMYMMARHLTLSRFFIQEADANLVPDLYRPYYDRFIAGLKQDHKRIFFDEFHRVSQNSSVSDQIVSDIQTVIRESRKWNIHIAVYSQEPGDIPETIANLSTTAFVFGVNGKRNIAEVAAERFGMDPSSVDAMMNNLRQPDRRGSTIIARYVVNEGKIVQSLRNTVGPIALWAFSSTREDTILRDRLYREFGPVTARRVLAKLYPGGSIKESVFEPLQDILSMSDPLAGFKSKGMGRYVPYYQKALRDFQASDQSDHLTNGVDPNEIIYLVVVDAILRETAAGV